MARFDRYMVQVGMGSHPKFGRLTDSEFRAHVVGVLSVAAIAPIRGCLLVGDLEAEPADIARAAGVTVRVARQALDKLQALGVLYRDDDLGCLRVHDWNDVNPEPRVDNTRAERQQRLRERRRNGESNAPRNAGSNAPRNGDVTPPTARMRASASTSPSTSLTNGKEATESQREADKHPEAARLAQLLADLIRQRDPKAKVAPDGDGWVREMRLLIGDRGGDMAEVERIVRWSQADHFWQGVILSPRKLREKFTQLLLKSQKGSGNGQRETASDWLRAMDGAA